MENCPRCSSTRVQSIGKFLWFFVLFGFGGLMMLAGFFLPFLWVVAVTFVVISPLGFLAPRTLHCQDCKYSWKAPKKKLETPAN